MDLEILHQSKSMHALHLSILPQAISLIQHSQLLVFPHCGLLEYLECLHALQNLLNAMRSMKPSIWPHFTANDVLYYPQHTGSSLEVWISQTIAFSPHMPYSFLMSGLLEFSNIFSENSMANEKK